MHVVCCCCFRPSTTLPHPWCQDQMELALPNDREIHGAVSSNTSRSLGPTTLQSPRTTWTVWRMKTSIRLREFVQLMRVLYTSTLCVMWEKWHLWTDHTHPSKTGRVFYHEGWRCNVCSMHQREGMGEHLPALSGWWYPSLPAWGHSNGPQIQSEVSKWWNLGQVEEESYWGQCETNNRAVRWDDRHRAGIRRWENGGDHSSIAHKKCALEELFSEEGRELRLRIQKDTLSLTLSEHVDLEVEHYKSLPPIPMAEEPMMWWLWEKRADLSLLTTIATSYLCAQASSTPSERVFSTAGNTISQERSRLLPEKANI